MDHRFDAQSPLFLLIVSLLLVGTSSGSVPYADEARPLKSLSEWLLRTGRATVVRARVLEAMNLPAIDMPILEVAKTHLKRATQIEAKFRLMALEDPDLEPLWASLATA